MKTITRVAIALAIVIKEITMPNGTPPTNAPSQWWQYANQYDRSRQQTPPQGDGTKASTTTWQQAYASRWRTPNTTQQDQQAIQKANQPAFLNTGNAPQSILNANQAAANGNMQPVATPVSTNPIIGPIAQWGLNLARQKMKPAARPSYNATPPGNIPTGSVLAAGGTLAQGPNGTVVPTNPSIYPTSTFLSGGGDVNTGIPYFPVLPSLEDQGQGGNGGFGSQYGSNWGRRRGYGYGGGYGGSGYSYQPAFGLNSWNFGE